MNNVLEFMNEMDMQNTKYDFAVLTLRGDFKIFVLITNNEKINIINMNTYIIGTTKYSIKGETPYSGYITNLNISYPYDDLSKYSDYKYCICTQPMLKGFEVFNVEIIGKKSINEFITFNNLNPTTEIISEYLLTTDQIPNITNLKSIIAKGYGPYIYEYEEKRPFDIDKDLAPKINLSWYGNADKLVDLNLSSYYGWTIDLYIYKYNKITMELLAYIMSKNYCPYFKISIVEDKYRIFGKLDEDFDNIELLQYLNHSFSILYDVLFDYKCIRLIDNQLIL